jgi:multiple sugar transport system permease protein
MATASETATRKNIDNSAPERPIAERFGSWLDAASPTVLLMPTVLVVLLLSIFPLIASLYSALARFQLQQGGFAISFVGFANFNKLLFGSEARKTLGRVGELPAWSWIVIGLFVVLMLYFLYQHINRNRVGAFSSVGKTISFGMGVFWRVLTGIIATFLVFLLVGGLYSDRGIPGTIAVTLVFVIGSVALQYTIGLILALLLTQDIPGKRFFRIIFLLPMMITPVGIGFLFRMLTNTTVGPLGPVWQAAGLAQFSMLEDGSGARLAIIIGDVWQWVPFSFIILLAALEGVSRETIEAARVDGASRWQLFRFIIVPEIVPVSTTVILIRMIETFKIIDVPNALTGGGPGTATESLTLHAFNNWRAIDYGLSAAISYILLFIVTYVAMVFVNIVRRRVLEAFA